MHDFKRLADLRLNPDGKKISFTLECEGGDSEQISCAIDEIPDIVSFLVNAAIIATERSGSVVSAPKAEPVLVDPMPALGLGFGAGRSPAETFLLVHTAAFHLVFSVPSSGLSQLAPELAHIASALSAGTTMQ